MPENFEVPLDFHSGWIGQFEGGFNFYIASNKMQNRSCLLDTEVLPIPVVTLS